MTIKETPQFVQNYWSAPWCLNIEIKSDLIIIMKWNLSLTKLIYKYVTLGFIFGHHAGINHHWILPASKQIQQKNILVPFSWLPMINRRLKIGQAISVFYPKNFIAESWTTLTIGEEKCLWNRLSESREIQSKERRLCN